MSEPTGPVAPARPTALPPVPPPPRPGDGSLWPFAIGLVVGLVLAGLGVLPLALRVLHGPVLAPRPVLLLSFPFWFPFGPYPGLPVLLLIVALVAWIVVRAGRWPGSGDALEILRQRYARGEIGREEYEARREVLRRG